MNRLYLDIETLPTTSPERIAEITASITPPGNISKPDTIAAWEAEKKPGLVAEAIAKTSFNGALGQVCCVGWAWNGQTPTCTLLMDSEAEFLSQTMALIEIDRPKYEAFHATQIIGHYVADFDLRFLWQRAFALGVKMPAWWPRDIKAWSKDVQDMMFLWAGAKGSISLDDLCVALGIGPMPDGELPGSEVAAAWARGEYERVSQHCQMDVERVRAVHRKMQIALGELE